MVAILFKDLNRTKAYGIREGVEIQFNEPKTKCKINDFRMKSCHRVLTKQMGRTQVITWATTIWDHQVYFRETILIQ